MDRREAQRCLEMARQAGVGLVGSDAGMWQAQVRSSYERLMDALDSYASWGDGENALEMAASLVRYWMAESATQGGVVFESLLTRFQDATLGRARALYAAGLLAFTRGENEASRELNAESLLIGRQYQDREVTINALVGLARTALRDADQPAIKTWCTEALDLGRAAGRPALLVWPLHIMAAGLQLAGETAEARRLYEESLVLNRELGNTMLVTIETINLGLLDVLEGALTSSEMRLREGLLTARERGLSRLYPVALVGLGGVAARRGDVRRAGSFIGSAERMLEASGQVLDPPDAWVLEHISAAVGREGWAVFNEARDAAQTPSVEGAIELALSLPTQEGCQPVEQPAGRSMEE